MIEAFIVMLKFKTHNSITVTLVSINLLEVVVISTERGTSDEKSYNNEIPLR